MFILATPPGQASRGEAAPGERKASVAARRALAPRRIDMRAGGSFDIAPLRAQGVIDVTARLGTRRVRIVAADGMRVTGTSPSVVDGESSVVFVDRDGQPVTRPRALTGVFHVRHEQEFAEGLAAVAVLPSGASSCCRHFVDLWCRLQAARHARDASPPEAHSPYDAFMTPEALAAALPDSLEADVGLGVGRVDALFTLRGAGALLAREFARLEAEGGRWALLTFTVFPRTGNGHIVGVLLGIGRDGADPCSPAWQLAVFDPARLLPSAGATVSHPGRLRKMPIGEWVLMPYCDGKQPGAGAVALMARWTAPGASPRDGQLAVEFDEDCCHCDPPQFMVAAMLSDDPVLVRAAFARVRDEAAFDWSEDDDGIAEGLAMALERGKRASVAAWLDCVLDPALAIAPERRVRLVRGGSGARNGVLQRALAQAGAPGPLRAYLRRIAAAPPTVLPREFKLELLAAPRVLGNMAVCLDWARGGGRLVEPPPCIFDTVSALHVATFEGSWRGMVEYVGTLCHPGTELPSADRATVLLATETLTRRTALGYAMAECGLWPLRTILINVTRGRGLTSDDRMRVLATGSITGRSRHPLSLAIDQPGRAAAVRAYLRAVIGSGSALSVAQRHALLVAADHGLTALQRIARWRDLDQCRTYTRVVARAAPGTVAPLEVLLTHPPGSAGPWLWTECESSDTDGLGELVAVHLSEALQSPTFSLEDRKRLCASDGGRPLQRSTAARHAIECGRPALAAGMVTGILSAGLPLGDTISCMHALGIGVEPILRALARGGRIPDVEAALDLLAILALRRWPMLCRGKVEYAVERAARQAGLRR